jgi:hypothetical protein
MSTPPEPEKATEHDIRCSTTCTRAGLTALLFSAIAISLLQPIEKKKSIDALGDYISLRSILQTAISDLDQDPCWQALGIKKEEEASFEKWSLPKISDYACDNNVPRKTTKPIDEQPNSVSKKQDKKKVSRETIRLSVTLGPPTNLKSLRGIDGIR